LKLEIKEDFKLRQYVELIYFKVFIQLFDIQVSGIRGKGFLRRADARACGKIQLNNVYNENYFYSRTIRNR